MTCSTWNSGCCGCGPTCQPDPNQDQPNSNLKRHSVELTGIPGSDNWLKRASARGMMRAVGYTDRDFEKPIVGVGTPYTNITPCNNHIKS